MTRSLVDMKADLIKSTLDPLHYEVMPPTLSSRTNFLKRFTYSGQWNVDDTPPAQGGTWVGPVTSRSGMVLWLIWRGIGSIARWGFVPKHTVVVNSTGEGYYTYTFSHQVPLPYKSGQAQQIEVNPSMDDFSFTRLVAGVVELKGNTHSLINAGSNTSISGTLACGVPNDTRDIYVNDQGSTFAPTDLVQQSITGKDSFLNVPLEEGAAMLIGSDIPPDYSVPERDSYVASLGGGIETVNILDVDYLHPIHAVPDVHETVVMAQCFISPMGVTSNTILPLVVSYADTPVQPINMYGALRFETTTRIINQNYAPSEPTAGSCNMAVIFQDVYALIDATGAVTLKEKPSHYTSEGLEGSSWTHSGPADNGRAFKGYHDSSIPGETIGNRGAYVGTRVTWQVTNNTDKKCVVGFTHFSVRVIATDLYAPGELGVSRVARWDSVADGQQITVTGNVLVQCVPEGTIAPYVQSSENTSFKSLKLDTIPLLSTLYNSTSRFQRIYKHYQWVKLVENILPSLSVGELLAWASETTPEHQAVAIQEAAQAGGFFGDFLSGLGKVGQIAANTVAPLASLVPGIGPEAAMALQAGGSAVENLARTAGAHGMFGTSQSVGYPMMRASRASGGYGSCAAGRFGGSPYSGHGAYSAGMFGTAKRRMADGGF